MNLLQIADKADYLVKQYKTRNSITICEALHIEVNPMSSQKLKGLYLYVMRNAFIYLNESLSEFETLWVAAHELGHHVIHPELARQSKRILETSLYDMSTRTEKEANLFAAELLIDEKELLEYIFDYGFTMDQCAKAMNIPAPLIALKTEIMNERGSDLIVQEYDRNFMR